MKPKHLAIIVWVLILAWLVAQWYTNKASSTPDEGTTSATMPGIKEQMCVKNGRTRDKELEKCVASQE